MDILTIKELVAQYQMGGWDLVKRMKDSPEYRHTAERIIDYANKRYDKLEKRSQNEEGFYSPALQSTKQQKLGQESGKFSADYDQMSKVQSEVYRALLFLDDTTSSVTGTRKNQRESNKRIFKKYFRGQTAKEASARWKVLNELMKNNPWLVAKMGEVGAYITSDQLQQWAREYTERAENDSRSFKEFLIDKIVEYIGIPEIRGMIE